MKHVSTGQLTITDLNDGVSAVLTNDSIVLAADSFGVVSSYADCNTTLSILVGGRDVSDDWTIVASPSGGVTGSLGSGSIGRRTYTVTGLSTDTGYVDLTATKVGSAAITRRFALAKAKGGLAGVSAYYVSLSASSQIFSRLTDSLNYSPEAITLTATPYGGAGTDYAWERMEGNEWVAVEGTTNTLVVDADDFEAARVYRVSATVGGDVRHDEMTLVHLTGGRNGVDAIVGFLTNESAVLAADSDGEVADFTLAGGRFHMYDGIADVTGSTTVVYSVYAVNGCNVSILDTGEYRVLAMEDDTANALLQAVYQGVTIQKVLSLAKSKSGLVGLAATYVEINYPTQAFTRADSNELFAPASIILTANPINAAASAYQWQFLNDDTWTNITGATTSTLTVNSSDFSDARTFRVLATMNGVQRLDQTTIVHMTGGRDGIDAVSGMLTNESTVFPATADGAVSDFSVANGRFLVYAGSVELTGSAEIVYSVVEQTNCAVSIGATGDYVVSNVTADSANALLQANYGDVVVKKVLSLAKARAGTNSTSRVAVISAPAQVFTRADSTAAYAPATVDLTAVAVNGEADSYQWQYWAGNTWNNIVGGTSAVLTVASGDFADSRVYRVNIVIDGETCPDQITLMHLTGGKDGTEAVSGFLTNENATLAATNAGVVSNFATATGTFAVFDGLMEKTGEAGVAYTVSEQTDCVVNISSVGIYTVTAMTADNASATLSAVYKEVTLKKVLTLSKSKAGSAGTDATYVEISVPDQIFTRADSGATYAPAAIVLTATAYNGTATAYQWQYSEGSDWTNIAGATSVTYSVASDAFPTSRTFRVRATIGSVTRTDELTLTHLTGGKDGTAAVSGFLTNENATLPASNAGVVSSFAASAGVFKVFDGVTDKTGAAEVLYSVFANVECTGSISAAGVFSVTAMTADTSTLVLQAVYNGVTIQKTLTLNKGRAALNGTVAQYVTAQADGYVFARADSAATYAPATTTLRASPFGGTASSYQWQYNDGASWANVLGGTTANITVGSGDFPGLRSYRVQAVINGVTVTDTLTLMHVTGGKNGADAFTCFLTNESATLAATNAGVVSNFTAAEGTFKVFDGITDKTGTAEVTYSVATQTGCTVSILATGVYSVSAMTADNATAVLQAVYKGATFQKVLTLAKSRAGGSGGPGARGAGWWYAVGTQWTDSVADAAPPGGKVVNDVVTISSSTVFASSKRWNGTAWVQMGAHYDGSLFVDESIHAAAIDTKGIIVRDDLGNPIIGVGVRLPVMYAAPGTENRELDPVFASLDAPKLRWDFNGTLSGWTFTGASTSVVDPDALTFTPTAADPAMTVVFPVTDRFSGGDYPKVRARVKRVSGTGTWEGALYYTTPNHGVSTTYYAQVDVPANPDEWTILEWDMAKLKAGGTDWTSNLIQSLRLDLVASSTPTSAWKIDWVAVGKFNTSVSPNDVAAAAKTASWGSLSDVPLAAISNSSITIDASGKLNGAGSGQVTIAGLGYGGDLNATNGAPVGTKVAGVDAATVGTAVTNFNKSNDRISTAVVAPTIVATGAAVDHTIRTDGSADVSFEWAWAGVEGDIDGFLIHVYQSTAATAYAFGTTPAEETIFTTPASKRAFILTGAAANKYLTFGVQAYRAVDKDINAAGVILSTLVKPSLAAENPYRPSATVAFAGDITGTLNGNAVATVVSNASAGKTASDALPGINNNLAAKVSRDANTLFTGQLALQSQYAILVGDANNGIIMGNTGLYGRRGGVTQLSVGADGTAYFGGTLGANVVKANNIEADAITVRHLKISGTSDNLVPDPHFKDPVWWNRTECAYPNYEGGGGQWKSFRVIRFEASTGGYGVFRDSYTPMFPIQRGGTYRVEFQVYMSPDFNGLFTCVWHLPNKDWNTMGGPLRGWSWGSGEGGLPMMFDGDSPGKNSIQTFSAVVYMEDWNVYLTRSQFRFVSKMYNGYIELGGISVTRLTDANLTVDGSITANKLKVDSLEAVSARIGLLRTADQGARIEIRDNLIEGFNSNNTRRFRLSAN